jgi:sugar lactone lactonase YvrE
MVYSPEGNHLKEIKFPAAYVTCTTWGGKNHDIIYLSTGMDRRENPDPEDEGGHMYMYKPTGARGQAKHEFAG